MPDKMQAKFVTKSKVHPKLSLHFSVIRLLGCASAVIWFLYNHFHSENAREDRVQVAKIGGCIVFLEFIQDNRKPRPIGRLVNIFKLFIYFWWLHVGWNLFKKIWTTLGDVADKQEHAAFSVNALNFLIQIKIWSQIEYIHQSFADVFSRFNLKAGVLVSVVLSVIGLYLSFDLAATSALRNSCDLQDTVLSSLFCHNSQPKSVALLLFSVTLALYYNVLLHGYKKTGKGFLPKTALINPDPSLLRPGDMVIESGALGSMAHEAVVHAELVLRNHEGQLHLFSSTMRAGARLEDFRSYMDKFANPPPGKTPAYYVVMRPKNLSPRQIDIMHQVALLMLEQNETFKKRVPTIIKTLPAFIQKFVNFVCKQGIDPRKPIEVGNMGFDSGYDWFGLVCGNLWSDRWTCIGAVLELYRRIGVPYRELGRGALGLGSGWFDPILPVALFTDDAFTLMTQAKDE